MPVIELHTPIRSGMEICFDLSRSIDLHQISTAHTRERAVGGRLTGLITLGETVSWEAVHFCIRQRLTTRITAFERPFYFRDEQEQGIFKSFAHDHYFRQQGTETLMTDRFDFESPLGICGRVFNKLVLTRYMTRLLQQRNEVIREFAESGRWREILSGIEGK
jgi:ligand-binding SRPBCC domain-containing protein